MYELFDEMMDFGFPQVLFVSNPHTQITDTQVMKEYITQESQRLEKTTVVPSNLTNVVSWRQEGIHTLAEVKAEKGRAQASTKGSHTPSYDIDAYERYSIFDDATKPQ